MIKEYTISNFKAFSTPATLPIKPITLIYGANSAGKSSIFQSLLLLKQSIPISESLEIQGEYLNFSSYEKIAHNNKRDASISFKFAFDINDYKKLKYYFSMNHEIKNIISEIFSTQNFIAIENIFSLHDDILETVKSDNFSLFVGKNPEPLFKFSESQLLKNHDFWISYWNSYGRDIAMKIFNKIHNSWKIHGEGNSKKNECTDFNATTNSCNDCNQYKKYFSRAIKINEMIENESNELENELVNLYLEYVLSDHDYNECFPFSHGNLNYALKYSEIIYDSDHGDYQMGLEDLFKQCNEFPQEMSWYLDNHIRIIVDMTCDIVQDLFSRLLYIGPHRFFPNTINLENPVLCQTGNLLKNNMLSNADIVHDINEYLSRLSIEYNISFRHFTENSILKDNEFDILISRNFGSVSTNISDVGYGIGQILPVILNCLVHNSKPILIEQPELHLHPALQAELGDLFIDSAMQKKNTLLIETHSEHVLLRIMRRIRETTNGILPEGVTPIRAKDVSVVYVESVETDGDRHSIIREMPLNDQGELVKAWPGGFFEEGLREVF